MKTQIFSNTADEVQKEMNHFFKDNPGIVILSLSSSSYQTARESGWQDFTIVTVVLIYK
jgi:hypothetical protein